MRKPALLILATMPPPIGGITMHIKRLRQFLDGNGYDYTFSDIRRAKPADTLKSIWRHRFVHFHVSNPLLRCALVTVSTLLGKKVVFTYHGNVGQYSAMKNLADNWSFRLAYQPIVLNQKSMELGSRMNKRTRFIPAFIPPGQEEVLPAAIKEAVLQQRTRLVCATNASSVSRDKQGREIYQVSLLVKIFKAWPEACLIISDPSGSYQRYFAETGEPLSENIILIDQPHSFFEVLKMSDVFLRITTTDGDSLSVKEALYLKRQVLATEVVNRPAGVQLVPLSEQAIEQAIRQLKKGDNNTPGVHLKNAAAELLELYQEVIN
ncbi:glycosyltransferase family 4 protein [Chitinophaga eiseniae]|uniref:Glycosyltransferase family 4 protein n=1 Tax=Chitinophaga eiseniae TaxID=634771 RepID=A0A847SPB4_9BACT|nr:glycosyltransferase family 4 protein [Chitinophaga eiseniae]NLR82104.1 glycosyltransferase family 4 protein [Chitinophaga eiseniae]